MDEKDNIRNEIEELAPGFPTKPTIVPPAGYFTNAPERILERWSAMHQKRHRIIALRRWVAAAAILAGLVIGIYCWTHQAAAPSPLQSISSADAYAYIRENMSEFDELLQHEETLLHTDDIITFPSEDANLYLREELDDDELEELF